ncbi:MAG: helix-turn-helix transcriptional regulator [Planctomycetes bacterium]|nr:helix-turn-helix transcriptional regulator [Planctomycetota bacterium]
MDMGVAVEGDGIMHATWAENVPLGMVWMDPQDDLALHQHSYVELVCVSGGHGTHLLRDKAWPIERGDVFVIPPMMEHGYSHCDKLQLTNLCIEASWCERAQLRSVPGFSALIALEPLMRSQHDFSSHLHLEENKLIQLEHQLHALLQELQNQQAAFQQAVRSRLDILLIEMAREHGQKSSHHHNALLQIEHVLQFIDGHFHNAITLDILSNKASMSVSTLSRYFQRCFQCSPMHYVLQRRLRKAQELLHSSDDRIAHIAKAVGLRDANYFSRVYKKYMGMSPQQSRA